MIEEELKVRLDIAYEDCEDKSDAYMMQRLQDEVELFDDSVSNDKAYGLIWDYFEER